MISAQEALGRLREGNRRFVEHIRETGDSAPDSLRENLTTGQHPFAIILGCSDSRVPAEIIFAQGLGDLFVIRVAGNIVAPSQVGSVEFAVEKFETPLVVVLGHTCCGAIEATLDQLEFPKKDRSPNLSSIVDRIRPSVETLLEAGVDYDHDALVQHAVRANIRASADHLRHGSPIIERLIQRDGLLVVGAEYSLKTGVVDFFDGIPDAQRMQIRAEEILGELKALGNEGTKKMLMKNHGVREPCFGVKIGDMKPIRKRIKKDHQLALDLYDSGNYDAMYLAGLIADDEKMTKRDLQRWVKAAYGGSLSGTTVPTVAAQGKHGWDMAQKWIGSKDAEIAAAGWATFSCLVALKDDADLDLPALKKLVTKVQKEIHTAPDAARYAMNNFIISVAGYVIPLSDFAKKAAGAIGPVTANLGDNQCKIPYAPDYIQKMEKRGNIGKKRKTVKC